MIQLSVVLITKNQEWNIAGLVESVLEKSPPGTDITLVDSASSDKTVEIASTSPINVISLLQPQRLTAAMGRYVGLQYCCGDLILFLDGDMELYDGWLERAFHLMKTDPQIAAITGQVIDRPKATPRSDKLVLPEP